MNMFQLETRPSSPSRIGHAVFVGLFCIVPLFMAAQYFVTANEFHNIHEDKVATQRNTDEGVRMMEMEASSEELKEHRMEYVRNNLDHWSE